MTRIVLVQCTSKKRDELCRAMEMYEPSDYYRKQRDYAMAVSDRWFIQSAEYGLVGPCQLIESYDRHAKDLDDPEAWAADIAEKLARRFRAESSVVEILGGKVYADPLTPELEVRGFEVHEPLRGLRYVERKERLEELTSEVAA